ncbi:MAG: hypothetical protein KDD66_08450 [Bdellovibrionales bacterium]|nr:hypothetical protein [Bdellovibrionales bacterium]
MPTLLESLAPEPVADFCAITRYEGDAQWPQTGDFIQPHIHAVEHGSLPIVWRDGAHKGRLWGSLSLFDVAGDLHRVVVSRHEIDTYDFAKLRLGPGRVGHRILRPLSEDSTVLELIAWFQTGTRRVFVVDRDCRPIGHIDLSAFIRALVDRYPALIEGRTVERVMLHNPSSLGTVLAQPAWQALLKFSRWRRMVFVYVLGSFTKMLTPTMLIDRLSANGGIRKLTIAEAFPDSDSYRRPGGRGTGGASRHASVAPPWPSVPLDALVADVLGQLLERQELLVHDPEDTQLEPPSEGEAESFQPKYACAGHLSMSYLFVDDVLPRLDQLQG